MKKVMIIILMLMVTLTGVYAGDGALELSSSSVKDGDKDVSIRAVFDLEFSNNVVNMKVNEANKAYIQLLDEAGQKVEIIVEMADDQISPELKRNVSVKAVNALEKNKTYTLVIEADFSAKNGSSLDDAINIEFTTEGGSSFTVVNILLMAAVMLMIMVAVFAAKKKYAKA